MSEEAAVIASAANQRTGGMTCAWMAMRDVCQLWGIASWTALASVFQLLKVLVQWVPFDPLPI
jgi:hypothetical protein